MLVFRTRKRWLMQSIFYKNKMENSEIDNSNPSKKTIKEKLKKYFKLQHIIGVIVGGLAGFLYYYFIGCANGACALKSNPYYTILLGILLGYLVADLFRKKKPR